MKKTWLIFCLLILVSVAPGFAQEITVAAAADLNAALTELGGQFAATSGVQVKLSFGASGNLSTQIQNGAPFDLFFSADEDYPKQLIEKSLAEKDSLYRYAIGRLVLWVPADSPLDIEHKGMQSLLDPSVKKISIANPQHAPYGRACRSRNTTCRYLRSGRTSACAGGKRFASSSVCGIRQCSGGIGRAVSRSSTSDEGEREILAGAARLLSHSKSGCCDSVAFAAKRKSRTIFGISSKTRSHGSVASLWVHHSGCR